MPPRSRTSSSIVVAGRADLRDVVHQLGALDVVREVADLAADVVRLDPEHAGDARREPADPELAIEEHRADVGALEQVLPCRC